MNTGLEMVLFGALFDTESLNELFQRVQMC